MYDTSCVITRMSICKCLYPNLNNALLRRDTILFYVLFDGVFVIRCRELPILISIILHPQEHGHLRYSLSL